PAGEVLNRTLQNKVTRRAFHPIYYIFPRTLELELGVLFFQRLLIIEGYGALWSKLGNNPLNLGNNITRLKNNYRIAYANIFSGNFVCVMQAGMLHGSTRNLNGVEHSNGCSSTGAPNANNNVSHNGCSLFGGVFVGNRCSRLLANNTKLRKQRSVVHFNNQAICNKRQLMALDVPLFNKVHNIVQRAKHARLLVASKPQLC